jgi:hypothetical protein
MCHFQGRDVPCMVHVTRLDSIRSYHTKIKCTVLKQRYKIRNIFIENLLYPFLMIILEDPLNGCQYGSWTCSQSVFICGRLHSLRLRYAQELLLLTSVPRSRMRGAIPPLPQYAFMAWCLVKQRDIFTFTFYIHICRSRTRHITVTRGPS